MEIKYPDITVDLSESDGNVFSIIGRTVRALRRAGVPSDDILAFRQEAQSGNYDHAIQTVMRTVETT